MLEMLVASDATFLFLELLFAVPLSISGLEPLYTFAFVAAAKSSPTAPLQPPLGGAAA